MKSGVLTAVVFLVLIALFVFAANDWRVPWAGKQQQVPVSSAKSGVVMTRTREPKPDECANSVVQIRMSDESVKLAGIKTHLLQTESVADMITANAEVCYPPGKIVKVAPRFSGVIRKSSVALGQEVSAGSVLAEIESSEFGQAKSDYLQAIAVSELKQKSFDREKELFEKKAGTIREYQEAETQLAEAKLAVQGLEQKLKLFGMTDEQIAVVRDKKDISPLISVFAPFDGTVVDVSAVPGEIANSERPIFSIANVDRMWAALDIYESNLSRITKDQKVTLTVEGLAPKKFPGKIAAVAGEVNENTRTIRVYADLKNVDGLLKARMYGRAEVTVRAEEPRLLVPRQAVQSDGDCSLVFVSTASGTFQSRKVELGKAFKNSYEVLGGLAAGEQVVTVGSFMLKTEVLRGQMGAG